MRHLLFVMLALIGSLAAQIPVGVGIPDLAASIGVVANNDLLMVTLAEDGAIEFRTASLLATDPHQNIITEWMSAYGTMRAITPVPANATLAQMKRAAADHLRLVKVMQEPEGFPPVATGG